MVRRSARLVFEILGALLAGAAIAVALVAWRLSSGPIELEFLTPYLEEALSDPDGPQVAIDRTVIVWQGWAANPELRAEGVTARGPDGVVMATVPAVGISVSLDMLLTGTVAPTRIELVQPRLHLLRGADGSISMDIGADDSPGNPNVVRDMLADLAGPIHRRGPLGQLQRLAVRDASIVVDDRKLGRTWNLPDGDFVLRRGDRGLEGTLSIELDLGARRQRLEGAFGHSRETGLSEVNLRFEIPDPSELAGLMPELAPLAEVRLPVRGEARLELGFPDQIHAAALTLAMDAGQIAHPALPGGSVAISSATGRLRWDARTSRLALEDLFIDLGGPTIAVTGTVDGLGLAYFTQPKEARKALRVVAETSLVDLPTATLGRLWPAMLVPGGRRWVTTNIVDGGVRDAQIRVAFTLPPDGGEPQVGKLDGAFSYHGLTVTYLPGLPPVRQVHGTARFDDQQMVLDVAGGTLLRSTRVERSVVRLTDFAKRDQQVAIEAQTSGPVREGLEVIDRPRLGFLARFGLRPADVSGDAVVRMAFAFPAIDALKMDDVHMRVTATVKSGAMPAGIRDWRLTDADLAFDVDKDRLELTGTGRLQGVPVSITGREAFSSSAPIFSEYAVKGRLGDDARRRLGYDLSPWVSGPADVELAYRSRAERRSELVVRADLAPATVTLAPVGWSKPPGPKASAEVTVDFVGDRPVRLRGMRASGPGLAFEGTADLSDPAWSLEIVRGTLGRTQLAGRVRPLGAGYEANLRGPMLDLSRLIEGGAADLGSGGGDPKPIRLDARFDRVLLGEGRSLDAVAVTLDLDGKGARRGRLEGRLANGGQVAVGIAPGADGRERVEARTNDLGALLLAVDGRDTFRGGTLRLDGVIADVGGKEVISGTVRGADYRLVRAPTVTKLLSVLSLTSMVSLLQGEGLPFTELRFDFVYASGRIDLRQGRAYGGAIGGTFEGLVDTNARTLDIEGTVVPAFTLNNLLGNIPILGTLLAGGKDEGVFAANFRVAGPLDDPGVSVNPLSALAPGILRKLFPFLEAGDPRNNGVAPGFRPSN